MHHLEEVAHDAFESIGGVVAWIVNTLASALVGLIVGLFVATVVHFIPRGSKAAH